MIKINLLEISEMKRIPARSPIPKIINKAITTYRNFDIPKEEGIYFIFDKEDNLIYIGKSINIQNRIANHINGTNSPIKNKDEVYNLSFILYQNKYNIEAIERIYIDIYKPKYNDIPITSEQNTKNLRAIMKLQYPQYNWDKEEQNTLIQPIT